MAQYGYKNGLTVTSLNAVAVAGNGDEFALPAIGLEYPDKFTWQIITTGPPTSVQVDLQGSIDNSNWFSVDSSVNVSGELRHVVNKAVKFLRVKLVSIAGGGTVTAQFFVAKP